MNDHRTYIRRITVATNSIDGMYYLCAKKLNMNENELALLYAMDDGEFHSQKQICEEWLIPKTTINTIIREYKQAGYIHLQNIPGKKRELQICLTDKGKAMAKQKLDAIYTAENEAMQATLCRYSPDFVSAYEHFSMYLITAFQEHVLSRKDPSDI